MVVALRSFINGRHHSFLNEGLYQLPLEACSQGLIKPLVKRVNQVSRGRHLSLGLARAVANQCQAVDLPLKIDALPLDLVKLPIEVRFVDSPAPEEADHPGSFFILAL